MKNIVLLINFTLCSFYYIYAQGLIVNYEETITLKPSLRNLSQIDNPQIRAAMEDRISERTVEMLSTSQLMVNNGISVYKAKKSEQQNRETVGGENGNIQMNGTINSQFINSSPHTYYKNHLDKTMLSQVNFDGKEYLIDGTLSEFTWDIKGTKQTISGYECVEASTKMTGGAPITAWYTPDIPISDGPSSYWGLPGLILYLDINNGMSVFSCTSIEQVNDLLEIETPDTGEKVSKEQFDNVIAAFMQRMQENNRTERGDNFTRINSSNIVIK